MKDVPELTQAEAQAIATFDVLQKACYANSSSHGFWAEQDTVMALLRDSISHRPDAASLLKAVENAFDAMKGDLMHSELGERTEAQRKNLPADKLPDGFSGEEEELADTVIRIFDYTGRKKMRLGLAIVLKMRYNASRPFMHGKKF